MTTLDNFYLDGASKFWETIPFNLMLYDEIHLSKTEYAPSPLPRDTIMNTYLVNQFISMLASYHSYTGYSNILCSQTGLDS